MVAADALDQRLQEGDGVRHDRRVAGVVPVDEPARELELGVQARSLAKKGVGGAVTGGGVAGEDIVGGEGGGCQPPQVDGGIADAQPRPLEHAGHVRNLVVVVFQQHGGARPTPQDHGRFEAPQLVFAERLPPSQHETVGNAVRTVGAVEQAGRVVAHLLGGADRKAVGADDRNGERVNGRERAADGRSVTRTLGQVRGVDAIALEVGRDEDAVDAGSVLAEHFGNGEGEEGPHPGGQRVQRARLGGEVRRELLRGGAAHDSGPSVVEVDERGVEAARGVLGERSDARHADPGEGRRHRRG